MCASRNGYIKFYDPTGPRGWLSTFWLCPIELDGQVWATVEHFFQAAKFNDPTLINMIGYSKSPADAKALAAELKAFRRADWHQVRDEVMLRALRAKFAQHPNLRRRLEATGSQLLVEDSDDLYWGSGSDGRGLNRLGVLLMQIRKEPR